MIKFLNEIISPSELKKDNSLQGIKNLQLYRVLLAVAIVGVPTLIVNMFFSISFGVTNIGIYNVIILAPVIIAFFFFKKLSFNVKLILALFSFYFLASFNFLFAGTAGAGIPLLLAIVSISTLFKDIRAGYRSIFISLGVMILFTYLFTEEIKTLEVDANLTQKSLLSWSVATLLFILLALTIVLNFGLIQKHLIEKINLSEQREKDLNKLNKELKIEIKKQEKTQKELLLAKEKAEESNRVKTDFIHNMTHEVRTPLNGIMGFSQLLKKKNVDEEKRIRYADIIINSGEQLQKIIEDILEISSLDKKHASIKITDFDVNIFLKELYEIFNLKNKNSKVKLLLSIKDEPLIISSDVGKIRKTLSNLIENALKFTSKGFVEFGYNIDGNSLVFYVKDSGIGISPENQKKIFDRFVQESQETAVRYGGLGLGLAIAIENIELLNGNISLLSDKSIGTTFYVTIPLGKDKVST